jgi:hypothetical protein
VVFFAALPLKIANGTRSPLRPGGLRAQALAGGFPASARLVRGRFAAVRGQGTETREPAAAPPHAGVRASRAVRGRRERRVGARSTTLVGFVAICGPNQTLVAPAGALPLNRGTSGEFMAHTTTNSPLVAKPPDAAHHERRSSIPSMPLAAHHQQRRADEFNV